MTNDKILPFKSIYTELQEAPRPAAGDHQIILDARKPYTENMEEVDGKLWQLVLDRHNGGKEFEFDEAFCSEEQEKALFYYASLKFQARRQWFELYAVYQMQNAIPDDTNEDLQVAIVKLIENAFVTGLDQGREEREKELENEIFNF